MKKKGSHEQSWLHNYLTEFKKTSYIHSRSEAQLALQLAIIRN